MIGTVSRNSRGRTPATCFDSCMECPKKSITEEGKGIKHVSERNPVLKTEIEVELHQQHRHQQNRHEQNRQSLEK